jgi:hypothetical protein
LPKTHTRTEEEEEEEEAQKLKNFFLEELHKEVIICFQLSFQRTHKKKKKKKKKKKLKSSRTFSWKSFTRKSLSASN